jgi:hypothetical protein
MKLDTRNENVLLATLILGACSVSACSNSPLVAEPNPAEPVAGEVLRLEADQGVMVSATKEIQRWADLSGNNHDGTAAGISPSLNEDTLRGTYAVRVSGKATPSLGQTQRLDLSGQFNDFSAGLTAFALVRVHVQATSATLGPDIRFPEFSVVGSNGGMALGLSADQESGSVQVSFDVGQFPVRSSVVGSVAKASDRWVLYSVLEDPTGKVQLFADGESIGEGTVSAPPRGATTASIIGGSLPADTVLLVVYNRALPPAERSTLERSIVAKWNYRR